MKPAFLRKLLACAFLCLWAGATCGQTVYKWTDETGKVHYGDKDNSPQNSKQVTIRPPAQSASPPPAGASGAPVAGNLQTCLAMARTMVEVKNPTPAQIRADSKQLLGICPDTAYECVSYIERPEANNCRAVPLVPGGHFTHNQIFRR